jgi:Domain of unknown function (DUF4291)
MGSRDHDPSGKPVERRVIQLGLRNEVLVHYAHDWIVAIEDISEFVREQHQHALSGDYSRLVTPLERVYPVSNLTLEQSLELSASETNDSKHYGSD